MALPHVANSFTTYVTERWKSHFQTYHLAVSAVTAASQEYGTILDIRKRAYRAFSAAEPCPVDSYSTLWLLTAAGQAIGTIRVTQAACGPLDCESQFPNFFRSAFPSITGSASRFCLCPHVLPQFQAARILAEYAWADALDRGIRCDVIDVNCRAIPYYRRLGYLLLRGHVFQHPLLGTPSRVMVAVANPAFAGRLSPLLALPAAACGTGHLLKTLRDYLE